MISNNRRRLAFRSSLLMTASERAMGRFMRGPDHPINEGSTDEFDAFVAAGEVETATTEISTKESKSGIETNSEPEAQGDEPEGDEPEGDEGADKKRGPKENQIERLKRERATAQREARDYKRQLDAMNSGGLEERLASLEKGLQQNAGGDNSDTGTPAPNSNDADLYPLGHLDGQYLEDKLEWLAEKKATERADAVLRRQQESEQAHTQQQSQEALLVKVDDLSARGVEFAPDFQEKVVEAAMKGEWDLQQATFEAVHEATHGAQILYELSQDKAEATRVAGLSIYQQARYVMVRDAELTKSSAPRRIPSAGAPPKTFARGANSRVTINPGTDNLNDFEKLWEADARKGIR